MYVLKPKKQNGKKKPSNKLTMAEARIKMEIFLKRQQKKNN